MKNSQNTDWHFSSNEDLEKIDNTSCGEIHTATEVIAVVCTGQQNKAKLIASAPKLLKALKEANNLLKQRCLDTDRELLELDIDGIINEVESTN